MNTDEQMEDNHSAVLLEDEATKKPEPIRVAVRTATVPGTAGHCLVLAVIATLAELDSLNEVVSSQLVPLPSGIGFTVREDQPWLAVGETVYDAYSPERVPTIYEAVGGSRVRGEDALDLWVLAWSGTARNLTRLLENFPDPDILSSLMERGANLSRALTKRARNADLSEKDS